MTARTLAARLPHENSKSILAGSTPSNRHLAELWNCCAVGPGAQDPANCGNSDQGNSRQVGTFREERKSDASSETGGETLR